jgi:Fic family protein
MYKPVFEITPELLCLIAEATELKTWIHQSIINVPWLSRLQKDTAVRLTHSSTAIEGNPLSLDEVHQVIEGKETSGTPHHRLEVTNQYEALRWVSKRKNAEIITEKSLLHLHYLITKNLLPKNSAGHFKLRPNRVVDSKGRTVYSPPPPEKAPLLTRELLAWINTAEAQKLHPIITSAIAHYQLVSIHPFTDGNGRISRALGIWLLYTRGFDTDHICALDDYFLNQHQLYYDKLTQARELDEDLTYWLEYVARGVMHTLRQSKERILSLQVTYKGPKIILTKRQEDLLRLLRDKGRLKSPDMEKAFNLTRARVAQIIKPLTEAGLVVREGQTRATIYRLP